MEAFNKNELFPYVTTAAITIFTLYSVYGRLWPKAAPNTSFEVGKARPGETAPRRTIKSRDVTTIPAEGVTTLYDVLKSSASKFATLNAMGARDLINTVTEEKEMTVVDENGNDKIEKKKFVYFQLGHYKWMTYKEFAERVYNVGSGLVSKSIGLKPIDSKLGIFCNTCPEWLTIAHACFSQSITVVTVYANLGEEGLLHAIHEGELTHLFCNADLLPLLEKVHTKCPTLKTVIYVDKTPEGILEKLQRSNIKTYQFEEILNIGKVTPAPHVPPKASDICVIMYTSGTTGLPKGVQITHANMVGALSGIKKAVDLYNSDCYIAYLPLAHVLELIVENYLIFAGVPMGYGNPRSLSDSTVRNCKGDLRELRPTIMAGVPAVWERIRKGALSKVEQSSIIARTVFNLAYKYKSWYIKYGGSTPILDALIFKKFKDQTGGRIRGMLTGSAPISTDSHEFLRVCFGAQVIQGYGLTECCGISNLMRLEDPGYERVGEPVSCTEIKLLDVPEMKYFAADNKGEICLRGTNVCMNGYFKNEEKTKEDFKDGWFHTGDVGQWNADGTLSIIDRKKNLCKLSHGEYVALEKLESIYKGSKYVDNLMVYGDSSKDNVVAVVVPVRAELQSWAKSKGLNEGFESLCKKPEAQKMMADNLNAIGRKEGLKSFEMIANVYLCPDEWTPENEMVTAAQKIKRQPISDKYKKEIEALYKK